MIKRTVCFCLVLITLGLCQTAFAASGYGLERAKGAVLMEAASGRIIAEHNGDERLPNASTTKIMTAILTLEQQGIDDMFTVDADAIAVEGSSMGLVEGDKVTLRTLAWGMLLASGNDAANAAAVKIDGSIDAFCERMNRKAAELGMKNTRFSSPSGLENGEHYTTAHDLAILARYAMQNEVFAEMVRSKSAKLYYGDPPYHRWLTNHNRLLWQCDDCIGIKTGFTKAAGRCLVSAARRDGLTLIAVTLGCPDDFNTHHTIYDNCFEKLKYIDFEDMASNLSVEVTGAVEPRVAVRPLWSPGAYMTADEQGHVELSITLEPFLYAPVEAGRIVGSADLKLNGDTLSTTPLVTTRENPSRFPERRSVIQRVKDFFDIPQQYRFPLNERENRIYG